MQLRTILVGVKPAVPDAHPLPMAIELATRAQARYTVLSVTDASSPGSRVVPNLSARGAVVTAVGIAAIEIARTAESNEADLIVLGRDLPTGRESRHGGDVIEGTVRRARVPCLLVPHGERAFYRVLAAVDGGPDSGDVIAAALLIGRLFDAGVRAVHVEEPVLAGVGAAPWSHHESPPGPAGAYETIVCQGDPVSEILRMLREDDTDLLVLGHHRGGPVSAHTTSGVAARLLQRAPCAVLTVPI
jgi:nucleotide-binding universal stress UspA family protein